MNEYQYKLLTELNKAVQQPSFTNASHEDIFENLFLILQKVVLFKKELLYQEHKISIDSFVESQIDLAQKLKRTETLKYWQWVQRRIVRIKDKDTDTEEGGKQL